MQFRDLQAQYNRLKKDIDAGIAEVIENSNFISGRQVEELERALASYVGVKHCVSCANGTDALTLALMTWKVGRGDAVFVPDFTFFSTAETVAFAGATPVFVDVDETTFNMSAKSLEQAVKAVLDEGKLNLKAIIPVDLFGQPADYPAIKKVAQKYGMLILEDGAQGFGGAIEGKRACSFGDISTTSFFPAKPLGCYGDGGAVFTNSDEEADYLRSVRVHGKGSIKYDNIRIGMNSRLDTIQAAVLLTKLKALEDYELKDINAAAELYSQKLKDVTTVPVVKQGFYSSWAQYTIRLQNKEEREGLQEALTASGIPSMVYYIKPLHMQKAFAQEKQYVDCSCAQNLSETVLSLPMHPYIGEEIDRVCDCVKAYLRK